MPSVRDIRVSSLIKDVCRLVTLQPSLSVESKQAMMSFSLSSIDCFYLLRLSQHSLSLHHPCGHTCATITWVRTKSTRDVKEVVFFKEVKEILDRWALEERMQKRTDEEKSMLSEEELKLDGSKIAELLKPFELQLYGCDCKQHPRKKYSNTRSHW
ncbi:hypothetical protein L3Y34_010579 [Caenorhabditis briggsae]|uniref:Uncharacterized protein n=1 Tax=Caenorhabditis briggsae TaxID=6238 RepID=A0AAE8ZRY8_CAEBR|nr:hypothetical protein L3Y34_010579 [Caenorhabditis briggsae]